MNASKTLQLIFVLALLGIMILLGCQSDQSSPTSQKNASASITQTYESGSDETNNFILDDTTAKVETPDSDSSQNVSPLATKEVEPTLILVADKVTSLDPYKMISVHPDESVASHLWDTLTLLNDDLQVEPSLAESWRLINNFTWEFELHPNLTFHNDEPINAEAVRFSIERAQSMPGSLETFSRDVNLGEVEVVDDHTLRLTTSQPVANLPYHLAFLEILPPIYYTETDPNQLAIAPVGSGPYQLSGAWTPDEALVLEAVSTYWKGTPTLPRLVFKAVPLSEERLAALRVGEATLVTDLPPMTVDQWDLPNGRLETIESTRRMFIGIPVEEGSPLAHKGVRQALNYGVNVKQITGEWLKGYGERYGSWVNPPSNNPELSPWPYDPDLARELMAEAGYGGGITLTLRTPAGVYYQDVEIAKAIAQQLELIGVTVQVETASNWGVYVRELLTSNTASLFLLGINSRGDGLEDTKNLSIAFDFTPTKWQNQSFDQQLERATTAFNESIRTRHLNQAQAIAYDEAPWIWLWRPYDFYGISQSLDWSPRRDGLVNLYKSVPHSTENSQ